jgi:outer membrane protein OmpA-like peptidoglycan-associated protein
MKNKFILFFCLLSFCLNAQNYLKRGDRQMSNFHFAKAAANYKKAADRDAKDLPAWEKLGLALTLEEDYASAEAVYQSLITNPLAAPVNKFYLAQILRINGKYAQADSAYKSFAAASPNDSRAQEFKNFAADLKPLLADNKIYELSNVPENSDASDIGPAYWNGGMVYASNRGEGNGIRVSDLWGGRGYYDLYGINPGSAGDAVSSTKIKGKINRRLNEGPATFSRDGKEMIFTRSDYKHKGTDGVRRLGLYHAEWNEKKGWTNIQPLPFNSTTYNTTHPALSKDGSKLYFSSDMPNGFGETDIYVSVKNGTTWENPVNLGKEINTPGNEMFPSIADDGTLYFASDSRVGLGGLDIYSATLTGKQWSNVLNLGSPISSAGDDFGYVTDENGKNGYMVSNRPGGLGDDDIYRFSKKAEPICGTVLNAKTKEPVTDAGVLVHSAFEAASTTRTNSKGDFCFTLPSGAYRIEAARDGYRKFEGDILLQTTKNERKIILLEPKGEIDLVVDVTQKDAGKLEGATVFVINKTTGEVMQKKSDSTGKVKFDLFKDQEYDLKVTKPVKGKDGMYDKFVKTISTLGFTQSLTLNENAQLNFYEGKLIFDLPNVYFDYKSWKLLPAAKKDLDKVVMVMKTYPAIQVELSSHTDSRGTSTYNYTLSALRANACVEYIAKKGADITHLIAIGFGEEKIRNKCVDYVPCSDAEHAVNRRTEFKVVKFD